SHQVNTSSIGTNANSFPQLKVTFGLKPFQNPFREKIYSASIFLLEPPNFRLTSPLLFVVPWAPARLTKSVKATTFALATPAPSFLETTFITIPLPVVVVPAAVARAAIAGRGANAG